MSAKGPDSANVTEPENNNAANTPAVRIPNLKNFKLGFMSITLGLSKLA